jgi:hypothetical protein
MGYLPPMIPPAHPESLAAKKVMDIMISIHVTAIQAVVSRLRP